jgi:hypothetical protein
LVAEKTPRPAFYALAPGGARDVVNVLHPPYTVWHVANVALGAAVAAHVYPVRVAAAIAAFFLAVGVGAHALDELNGRPLGTQLSKRALIAMAVGGLGGALAIGIVGVFVVSPTLIPLILFGAFIAPAYNLELFGGRFHTDFWLAASWGGFSALTGWWVNALGVHSVREGFAAAAVVVACYGLTRVQRHLSTPVRDLRRRSAWPTAASARSTASRSPRRSTPGCEGCRSRSRCWRSRRSCSAYKMMELFTNSH